MKQFSVRFDGKQAITLERLAQESGRSKASVLGRLVLFATISPEAQKYIGCWDYLSRTPKIGGSNNE